MRRALAATGAGTFAVGVLWLLSEMLVELHRLDELVADTRVRVDGLEGFVDRLKPATDYWWLKRR